MLEIIGIAWLAGKVAEIVENKGHRGGKYRWMAAGLWLGGEFVGAIVGTFIGLILTDGGTEGQCVTYIVAIIGAIIGAVIAIQIANNVPSTQEDPE